jgi:hypothetical protein
VRRSFWPDDAASVVLLPPGEVGVKSLELARVWCQLGLVSPALWVVPEGVKLDDHSPPNVRAFVLGRDEFGRMTEVEVDLFDLLSRWNLKLVRFLMVTVPGQAGLEAATHEQVGKRLAEVVRLALPLPSSTTTLPNSVLRYRRIHLLVAPTDVFESSSTTSFQRGWDINLIASPEDRKSPWTGDRFVRDDSRFVGFLLGHVMTAAGIWTGLPRGSLEFFEQDASSAQGTAWVQRVFVRGVMSDGIARRIAARALSSTANPHDVAIDPVLGVPVAETAAIQQDAISGWTGWMVDSTFAQDGNRLSFNASPPRPIVQREKLGFFKAIRAFLRFVWGKLKSFPRWIWNWFAGGLAARTTAKLYGADGVAEVQIGKALCGDKQDLGLFQMWNSYELLRAEAQKEIGLPIPSPVVVSTPQLWRSIRQFMFGMLDGSSLPEGVPIDQVMIDHKRMIFPKLDDVVFNPAEEWETPDVLVRRFRLPKSLGWKSLTLARDVDRALDQWVGELAEREIKHRAYVEALELELNDLEAEIMKIDYAMSDFEIAPDSLPRIEVDNLG